MRYFYCLLLLLTGYSVYCQNYTRDKGLTIGDGIFLNYRQFYSENEALEGIVGYSQRGVKIIVLREYFQQLAGAKSENLNLVYGYGIHAGVAYTNKYKFLFRTYYHDWKFTPQFGLDGIVGLEYALPEFPALIRVAAQPFFEYSLNRYFKLTAFNFVASFKYRF